MERELFKNRWVKVAAGIGGVALAGGTGWSFAASNYVPTVAAGVTLSGNLCVANIGGLTKEKARTQIQNAWSKNQDVPIARVEDPRLQDLSTFTPRDLGINLETDQTLAKLPMEGLGDVVLRKIGIKQVTLQEIKPVITIPAESLKPVKAQADKLSPKRTPATASMEGEVVVRQYERAPFELDLDQTSRSIEEALTENNKPATFVLQEQRKLIADADIDKISTVIGHFATNFSSGPSRTNNIRVASHMLNGHIVMPGEKFSFNETLGQRTEAKGFQRAGIYLNGKHDFDTGGGVCQVSTTLYNAVLQAGLQVVTRQPHSMPVAYVPLGQDATVSYPSLDFAFKNTTDAPIAISTKFRDGRVEFFLLGKEKKPGTVHIENKLLKTYAQRTETEFNPNLPPGTKHVKEKGSAGREVASWRVVTVDGKTTRTSLGISSYRGGPTIVEIGPAAPSKPKLIPVKNKPPIQGTPASLNNAH